jgi:isoleucyl-tRNA synthetase
MDQHGADAVRWYMLAAGSPWSARRVGHDAISDVVRKTLLTYWNTISFFTLYAKASDFSVGQKSGPLSTMDKWILSELNELIEGTDKAYANFDSQEVGKLIANFIDDLSNWYVRRSRRKFWDGDVAALNTLYTCLKELTLLMAPMVPFITEHVWQKLVRVAEPSVGLSVHLEDFPVADKSAIDSKLADSVRLSRRLVELGRAARAESKVKIRQPLSRALIAANGLSAMPPEIREHISDELNVLNIDDLSAAGGDLVDISIKANFKSLGARYGADVQAISKAIAAADAGSLVKEIRANTSAVISYGDKTADLSIDDLVVTETPKEGWAVASHSGESVALDLELTPDLIAQGLVREVIRAVQEARKQADFDISDRINISMGANPDVIAAVKSNQELVASETLALAINYLSETDTSNELGLKLEVTKA